ncbi:MAG: hypothetical protein AAF787_20030, partial [Chloroflexota bacterium]
SLLGNATIVPNRNNLTVQIQVDSYDPGVAMAIAEQWGNLLIEYRNQENAEARREDRVDAILQDEARAALDRPRPEISGLAGGVLGFIVGLGAVLLLEFIESSVVRSRDDVERYLEMTVLASIPD